MVSYGGHGGGKAKRQLEQVLRGVGMRVVDEGDGGGELCFPHRGGFGEGV